MRAGTGKGLTSITVYHVIGPMRVLAFHVDAFTTTGVFTGNPAGVCLLERWIPDSLLQTIAAENNFSTTAFVVRREKEYDLRWFTPLAEIDLGGHATLAAAYVLWYHLAMEDETLHFETKSGPIAVRRKADLIELDFPAREPKPCALPSELKAALGVNPQEVLKSRDFFFVYKTEEDIRKLKPNFEKLAKLESTGIIVTARGKSSDFVSRFFAPRFGVPEDQATGSAHCSLIPYWSKVLGKKELRALQLSPRGGEFTCEHRGARVGIAGRAVTFLEGVITLADPK